MSVKPDIWLRRSLRSISMSAWPVTFWASARSDLIARSLELAPFHKLLYSSDACGPAEFHYLGARLWRTAVGRVIGGWVETGDWSEPDARRVVAMIASGNARRVYGLSSPRPRRTQRR